MSFLTMALFGSKTASPHGNPDKTQLEKNNFVLFDLGVIYQAIAPILPGQLLSVILLMNKNKYTILYWKLKKEQLMQAEPAQQSESWIKLQEITSQNRDMVIILHTALDMV